MKKKNFIKKSIKKNICFELKKLAFIYSVIILISCGDQVAPHYIDPYFDSFIENFKRDADLNSVEYGDISDISIIKFDNISSVDRTAECSFKRQTDMYDRTISYKFIVFQYFFKTYSQQLQYQIFLHEMGHCAYHLSHSSDPLSIMYFEDNYINPFIFPDKLREYFEDAQKNKKNWYSYSSIN